MILPMLMLTIAVTSFSAYAQQVEGFYSSVSANGTTILTNVRSGPGFAAVRLSTSKPAPPTAAVLDAQRYTKLINHAARLHGVPEALLHAVIQVESGYNASATSSRGAVGLMQLMPATAAEMGVVDIWDPASNISGGARYLRRLLNTFDGNVELALAAYNAGPGAVQRHGRVIPPFTETQTYVPRVLRHYRQFQLAHQDD